MNRAKNIAILGSGGSLGEAVLGIARCHPDRIHIKGLAVRRHLHMLGAQVEEFQPKFVAHGHGYEIPRGLSLNGTRLVTPEEMVTSEDVDTVVVATSGAHALDSIIAAIHSGKTVVLGTKEATVIAGPLLMREAEKNGARLIPMDSETTAVWQTLLEERDAPSRLIIPSRWGPLLAGEMGHMARVSPDTFTTRDFRPLGHKRAIDASTLINKAMQVIEAHYLSGVPLDRIQVVYHPQDRVRALVELRDGTIKSFMAHSDPRVVIQIALSFPERWENPALPHITAADLTELAFYPLEEDQFPCFTLALDAVRRGGTYPAALNAANETAVSLFLFQQIGFQEIPRVIERTLATHKSISNPTYKEILATDRWARDFASSQVSS